MSIPGPSSTIGIINQTLHDRMVGERFLVTGGDRGLEFIRTRLWRLSDLQSPNLLGNSSFISDPFDVAGVQYWESWGGPLPVWSSGAIDFISTLGSYPPQISPGLRTIVKARNGLSLQLQSGVDVEVILTMSSTMVASKDITLRVYSGNGQSVSQVFSVPSGSPSTPYTLNFTTSSYWQDVNIEITYSATSASTDLLLEDVSFKIQTELSGTVGAAVYEDDDGQPGKRVAVSTTVLAAHSGLTNSPANYDFQFASDILLRDNVHYHVLFFHNTSDYITLYDNVSDGQNVWIMRNGSSTFGDMSYVEWLYGTGYDLDDDDELYYAVFYTDTVPDAPDYPLNIDWPCECSAQAGVMNGMVEIIQEKLELESGLVRDRMELDVGEEPGLGIWGTRWIEEGGELPLPDWMNLLWRDENFSRFGGQFTTLNNAIYRAERKDIPRNVYTLLDGFGHNVSSNSLQTTNSNASRAKSTFSFTVKYPSYLHFQIMVFCNNPSAIPTAEVAWTYFLNGVNARDLEIGVPGTPQTNSHYERIPFPRGDSITAWSVYYKHVTHPFILQPGLYSLENVWWSPAGAVGLGVSSSVVIPGVTYGGGSATMILELIRA